MRASALGSLLAPLVLLLLVVEGQVSAQQPELEPLPASSLPPLPPPPPPPSGVVPIWELPQLPAPAASAPWPLPSASAARSAPAQPPAARDTRHPHGRGGFVLDAALVTMRGTYTLPLNPVAYSTSSAREDQTLTFSGTGFGVTLGGKGAIVPGLFLGGRLTVQAVFMSSTELSGSRLRNVEINSAILMWIEPFLEWYVDPKYGFFLQAGGGMVTAVLHPSDDGTNLREFSSLSPFGVGYSVGAGYRGHVAPSFELGGLIRLHGVRAWESLIGLDHAGGSSATFGAVYPSFVLSMVAW